MTNLNTPSAIVTGAPDAPPAAARAATPRVGFAAGGGSSPSASVMTLLTTAFVVTLLVQVPYVIESPGNAETVQDLITVPPDHSYPDARIASTW